MNSYHEWTVSAGLNGAIHKIRHPILSPEEYEHRRRAQTKAAVHLYHYCQENGILWPSGAPLLTGESPHPDVERYLQEKHA